MPPGEVTSDSFHMTMTRYQSSSLTRNYVCVTVAHSPSGDKMFDFRRDISGG